jgi:hypothetical protein
MTPMIQARTSATHQADIEPGDLERLAGGSLAGTVLALACGLGDWNVMLAAGVAGVAALAMTSFRPDHRRTVTADGWRRQSAGIGPRHLGHTA